MNAEIVRFQADIKHADETVRQAQTNIKVAKAKLTTSSSRSLTVDGLPAWEIKFQVRISYLDNIPGDNVEVLVVQHTDGSRSGLLTFATIGDTETQRQVDGSRAGVRVEKR